MCPDALLSSLTSSVSTSGAGTESGVSITTSGSGTGAIATLSFGANSLDGITITTSGSGYQVGDTLTISATGVLTATLTFTLKWDDFANGELLQTKDILDVSGVTLPGASDQTSAVTNAVVVTNGAGHGITLSLTWESNAVTGINVTSCTRGFHVGDIINITHTNLGNNAIEITLERDDFVSVPKKSTSFYNDLGSTNSFSGSTYSGYYLPLRKSTRLVSIVSTYTGSLTPILGSESDSALTSTKASRAFSVKDGLNLLMLKSSTTTYEVNLVKPDEEVKAIMKSKRSIEIAYTPAAAGEFTCSAFASSSSGITNREHVKTANGVVSDSVRTVNVIQRNIFSSVQMTLNGLIPDTEYDIYCFHMSHGIISNNDVKTDKAALTSVSLVPSITTAAQAFGTLTLTFTHEKSLGVADTIVLKLYEYYDSALTVGSSDGSCSLTTTTSNGITISGSQSCSRSSIEKSITFTLGGASTVSSSSSGNIVVFKLSSSELKNPTSASTPVTYDLTVTGHSQLLQQEGWSSS